MYIKGHCIAAHAMEEKMATNAVYHTTQVTLSLFDHNLYKKN